MIDRDIPADDLVGRGDDEAWFSMSMTREEKLEARRPWRKSLVIKLIRKAIGYHYLWRQLQAMWRTQGEPLMIDLGHDFFKERKV